MANIINITPKLTPKQKEALRLLFSHNNGITEVLYGGAAGGGKSYLGCLWLILCALKYPNSRWLIGRSKLTTLKKTTLKTFFEVAKNLNLVESINYKYNQLNNEIKFDNGSEIILKDLFSYPSDPEFDSLGSLEIAGAFIDECNQVSEKAKNIVMSRIRHKLDEFNISPKLFMSCNPSRNWTYNEYYKKAIDGVIESHKTFIQALSTDNQFISKHYLVNLERQDEITKNRLLYGRWDFQDSLAMFEYDGIINMFYDSDPEISEDEKVMTVDVARLGKDSTCILIWDNLNIIEIIELHKKRINETKLVLDELIKKYSIKKTNIIIDSDGVGGGLADQYRGCQEIVNNSRPLNDENYQNLKTQLYYKLAELVNENKIQVFTKDINIEKRITQELQILKREDADQDGKIKMTSKDKIKTLISRSPDISDAMAYRMYLIIKKKGRVDFGFTMINI